MTITAAAGRLPGIGMSLFADRGHGMSFRPRVCFDASGSVSPEVELKNVVTALKAATDDVKKQSDTTNTELKNLGKVTDETKAAADKALTEMGALTTRLTDIEQKMARRGSQDQGEQPKTFGQHVVENEEVKSRLLGGGKKGTVNFAIETKAILSGTASWGSTASTMTSITTPDRQALVPMPMRQMTIRDLIAPGQTNSNSIEFAIQTTRTNNAAVVAEGALKPSSNYVWDLRAFPVRTIAHLVKASRQILDDAPALQSTIDAEMRYGLEFAEEAEMLYGDGTGAHLLGIVPQATAYSAPFTEPPGTTAIDRVRLAMLQSVQALLPVTGIVFNPLDWAKVETLKDSQGRYLVGDPQGVIQPRLWGLPVVASLALTAGTFLTGSFKYASQIFDRMQVEMQISTENNDDFEKNMITLRCEERLALVCKRPAAFVTGNLP